MGLLFRRFIIRRRPITIRRLLHITRHPCTTHIRRVIHTDIRLATTAPAEQHSVRNHIPSQVTAVGLIPTTAAHPMHRSRAVGDKTTVFEGKGIKWRSLCLVEQGYR
ncbi:MAG: hypothetical protein P4L90_14235 [Rhodopila sp.]|nr:hypothetical protein [Rhodopila sp.]